MARGILKVNSFGALRTGRHTAKSTHCLCCSLVVVIDPEHKDIAINFITCCAPLMPGTLNQKART
jgi:hypothetical protein